MDAKELAGNIYRAAFLNHPGFFDMEKAESLISSALSAQTAEVERLTDGIKAIVADWESQDPMPDAPNYSIHGIARTLRAKHVGRLKALLSPDAQGVKP